MSTPVSVHAQEHLYRPRCVVLPCPLVVLEIGGELTQVSSLFLLRPFGLPLLASVSACSAELNNRHGHARRHRTSLVSTRVIRGLTLLILSPALRSSVCSTDAPSSSFPAVAA